MNLQGKFPDEDKGFDGWKSLSPVDAFPAQNNRSKFTLNNYAQVVYSDVITYYMIMYIFHEGRKVNSGVL